MIGCTRLLPLTGVREILSSTAGLCVPSSTTRTGSMVQQLHVYVFVCVPVGLRVRLSPVSPSLSRAIRRVASLRVFTSVQDGSQLQ